MRIETVPQRFAAINANQLLLLNNVPWSLYRAISDTVKDRPAYRLTYDSGSLEIMTTSYLHELVKDLLGDVVKAVCSESGQRYMPGGSFTLLRPDLDRALEADQSYYVMKFPFVRNKMQIDLEKDPPPDLCIEIDVTNRSVKRIPIYAMISVPEVWRWESGAVTVYTLQPDGEYATSTASTRLLPGLDLSVVSKFIGIGLDRGGEAMTVAVRSHVKRFLARKKN
jgi:Uma2 family endonuclease